MNWTHPAIRRLRESVDRGETNKQIAASMGVPPSTIRAARGRYGICRASGHRGSATIDPDTLRAEVEAGRSDYTIGAMYGLTRGGVRHARRRYGIPANPRQPSIVVHDVLAAMIADDKPDAACARHFRVSEQTIRNHRRSLGVVRPGRVEGWQGAPPIPDAKINLIRAAAVHGWSRKRLMSHFQLGPARLTRILAAP